MNVTENPEYRKRILDEILPEKIVNETKPSFIDAVSKVIVTTKVDQNLFRAISMLPLNAELIFKKG